MNPILIEKAPERPIELLCGDSIGAVEPRSGVHGGDSDAMLGDARIAAEAHRRSRYHLQNLIRPGMSLQSIVDILEDSTRRLLRMEKNNGIGFPTGVSLNDCAAHHTTGPGDPEVLLRQDDVLKIDIGTHVNGRIMDSAFTVCFDPRYEALLRASKEGTERGIRCIGVDVRVCDIGAEIEEVIRSFELSVDGNTHPIRPIENLNGHSIGQYEIHSGITIPIVKNHDRTRIRPGMFYAIETFATTGKGYVNNGKGCSHFSLNESVKRPVENPRNKRVLSAIKKMLGTLPFCPRHVDRLMENKETCKPNVEILAGLRILDTHPPLFDSKGSRVAQFEHTVFLSEAGKEVLTRGDDY